MLTWRPIHIWSSISCTKIKLRIWRTSQIPQFHLAHLTMIFCTIRLWFLHQSKLAVDGLFLRTSEVVVKNMVCSIHCLGNNDGFKQLLLENISSAKMSEAARLSYKTQSLCCTRDAGGHISIHNWNWQKHLGKEQIKKKKPEYIQPYIFNFFQKSHFLSHKWFDLLWVLNTACKIAGAVSVLISNPIKGSNQVHFNCSTVCLYHKLFLTGV